MTLIRKSDDALAGLPPLMTEATLAELLYVPLSRIQTWRRDGRLGPFVKAGSSNLMRKDTFITWLKSREV